MGARILTDTMSIGALTTLVKLAGALKMVVIAQCFGANAELDAYLLAFLLPSFLGEVLAGAITPALLPILVEIRERRGRAQSRELGAQIAFALLILTTSAGLVFGAALWFVLPWFGLPRERIALTTELLAIMLPILPCAALTLSWRTLLYSEQRFAAAAAAPVLTPLAVMASAILLAPSIGARALAIGTAAGAGLECLVLAFVARAAEMPVFPRPVTATAEFRRVLRQYLPAATSTLVLSGSAIIDQTMAALLGPGSVSALNYGTRLSTVLMSVGPGALGTAVFPRLAALRASGDDAGFRRALRRITLFSLAVSVPVTVALIAASERLVRVLFERGAFTAADTQLVAAVQALSLIQLPFLMLTTLLVRTISSLQQNRLLIGFSVMSLGLNVVLNLVLMRQYGVAGIALSTALVQAAGAAYLAPATFRALRDARLSRVTDVIQSDD